MTIQAYHRPETVAEAIRLINQTGDIAILAGGTSLVAATDASEVVDLQSLPLADIEIGAGSATIGAMVRLQGLVSAENLPPFIRETAQREEINTFRNAGTLGGLVARADNESELYATLLAFGAMLHYKDKNGAQSMALADYQPGTISGGIITAVTIQTDGEAASERVARTPADKPIVAIIGRKSGDTLTLTACGVAPTPILIQSDQLDALTPPADFRGSTAYRRQMASILSQRVQNTLNANTD
ncbi:MAG: FAD binding domain-containing protein [Candidatus Promineifilaceae bacterium]